MRLALRRTSLTAAVVAALSAAPVAAQSVLDRTPNLPGGWVGTPGQAYFNFLHRFDLSGSSNKVVNSPTLFLGYTPVPLVLAGISYVSSSDVAGDPNEWELLARLTPVQPGSGLPFELGLTAAYNQNAKSLDGELALGVPVGPVTFMGAVRGFTDGYGSGDGRLALGGGARLRLSDGVALAADVVTLTDKRPDEEIGWGAGVQLAIPYTPHTISFQAANTNSATLQGSSRRSGGTRWGFEFTVPITLSRYFGGGPSSSDRTISADTVRVAIRDFTFGTEQLTIEPGTTVVWVNEGGTLHTSTSDEGLWNSPLLAPGESYARVFREAGEFAYHCTPHPFMTGTIVVREPGD